VTVTEPKESTFWFFFKNMLLYPFIMLAPAFDASPYTRHVWSPGHEWLTHLRVRLLVFALLGIGEFIGLGMVADSRSALAAGLIVYAGLGVIFTLITFITIVARVLLTSTPED